MAARRRKKSGGGATKPRCPASGVRGNKTAVDRTTRQPTANHRLGRLLKGFLRVRMMKITSTCVAMDSMNQPVWKSASPAWKTLDENDSADDGEADKIARQGRDDTGTAPDGRGRRED
jgi:hypothetical protein